MSGPLILVVITVALIIVSPFSDLACRILERAWHILQGWLPDREFPAHPRPPFDVRAARRHAHSLGLPFPEADGSVSWPGDGAALPDQLVHDQIHGRRMLAQFGVTGDEALARIERCIPHLVQAEREKGVSDAEIVASLKWWTD